MKEKKHKCCECGKTAIWKNTRPQDGNGLYYCDDCVPRNHAPYNLEDWDYPTSKNIVWWDKDSTMKDFKKIGSKEFTDKSFYYDFIDKNGKRVPSVSFIRSNDGFLKSSKEKNVLVNGLKLENCLLTTFNQFSFTSRDRGYLKLDFNSVLVNCKKDKNQTMVGYNLFMSKFGDKIYKKINNGLFHGKEEELFKFFNKFKKYSKKIV